MSVWKSHEKLSLLHPNFLLLKSFCSGLNTVKQKHGTFPLVFFVSGIHFVSLSMVPRT